MKPITVGNDTYTSIAAAARAIGKAPLITIRWRLKNGWTPSEALGTPIIPPVLRRNNKSHRQPIDNYNI